MALVSIPNTFTVGATIVASQHNSNFSVIFSDYNGNIDNTNISASAAIADTKLAQITTAGKLSGAAFTSISSIPAGAGVVPIANLATGTPSGSKFIRDDGVLAAPVTGFGVFTSSTADAAHLAATDVMVVATFDISTGNTGGYIFYTDGSNPPTTQLTQMNIKQSTAVTLTYQIIGFCKKNNYWKLTTQGTVAALDSLFFIPLGI